MAGGYLFEYLTEDGSNNGFEVFHSLPDHCSARTPMVNARCTLIHKGKVHSARLLYHGDDSLLLKQCLDTRPALISVKQVLLANSDHKIVERAKKKVDAMKASEAASRKITPSRKRGASKRGKSRAAKKHKSVDGNDVSAMKEVEDSHLVRAERELEKAEQELEEAKREFEKASSVHDNSKHIVAKTENANAKYAAVDEEKRGQITSCLREIEEFKQLKQSGEVNIDILIDSCENRIEELRRALQVINDKKKTEEEVEELRKKEREATHDLKRAELVYKARLENVQKMTCRVQTAKKLDVQLKNILHRLKEEEKNMMVDVENANFNAAWAICMDAQLLSVQERIPIDWSVETNAPPTADGFGPSFSQGSPSTSGTLPSLAGSTPTRDDEP
ncbi:hypothetical protein PRIPAC_97465 [Pristionchus pacificus]|uniref:Uncharacterized protein n=1 Tax=Pristionchus pacificus TaxID=54126 RepID=A0A2A6BCZ3_PRIPA|nr:hypothetical protein PRIPAC_97465 [Pristionchus pacificus]|eukprot:PDM63753.1 hypothetical protein PRIPAC_49726 [Pristionchus pacificus]